MRQLSLITLMVTVLLAVGLAGSAGAYDDACYMAQSYPWHCWHYHSAWGVPVALVVPPTADMETNWGWGVGNSRTTHIWHQFGRDYPAYSEYNRRMFSPTPRWPSDTTQFGVYYIRGPW